MDRRLIDNIILSFCALMIVVCVVILVKPTTHYSSVKDKYTSPDGDYVVVDGVSYKGDFSIGDKVKVTEAMLWKTIKYN